MRNNNSLEEIFKGPVSFTMKWEPGAGMTIERKGPPPNVSVLTCFALMRAMMEVVQPEKQNPQGVYRVLVDGLTLARELYESAEITTIDVNELRKQAQDAGE